MGLVVLLSSLKVLDQLRAGSGQLQLQLVGLLVEGFDLARRALTNGICFAVRGLQLLAVFCCGACDGGSQCVNFLEVPGRVGTLTVNFKHEATLFVDCSLL